MSKINIKNLFLLGLLLLIYATLSLVAKLIANKAPASLAQAQCWTPPAPGGPGGCEGSACVAESSACGGDCAY